MEFFSSCLSEVVNAESYLVCNKSRNGAGIRVEKIQNFGATDNLGMSIYWNHDAGRIHERNLLFIAVILSQLLVEGKRILDRIHEFLFQLREKLAQRLI